MVSYREHCMHVCSKHSCLVEVWLSEKEGGCAEDSGVYLQHFYWTTNPALWGFWEMELPGLRRQVSITIQITSALNKQWQPVVPKANTSSFVRQHRCMSKLLKCGRRTRSVASVVRPPPASLLHDRSMCSSAEMNPSACPFNISQNKFSKLFSKRIIITEMVTYWYLSLNLELPGR